MTTRTVSLLLGIFFLSSGAFASQDFTTHRSKFLDAIRKMDESRVRSGGIAVAQADHRQAVDTLLDGFGICARQGKLLSREKAVNLRTMEENSDFEIDTSTNPPTIPAKEVDKYQRYEEAVKVGQGLEQKIMRIEKVKRAIISAMTHFRSAGSVQHLALKLKNDPLWQKRAGIAEAMGTLPEKSLDSVLLQRLKKDAEPQVKIAILDALRVRKATGLEVVSGVSAQLKSRYWQVQSTALSTLRALGPEQGKGAIEPLLKVLEKAKGRLQGEINKTLVAITGVNKHGSVTAWRAWWEENRPALEAGQFQPRPEERAGRKQDVATTFYGIPVDSENVIFILDNSGSMSEPSKWEIPEGVATGKTRKNRPAVKKEGNRKIDVARWQLKQCLAGLKDGVKFNILFFNHEWKILSGKMIKLSSGSLKAAFKFIDELEPVGGTNIYDPMEKAFTFAGAGLKDQLTRTNIDTIFLLTDGMPNAGQIPNGRDILLKIRETNKTKKVKVNTVGVFGTLGGGNVAQEGESFLKELSENSGGKFVSTRK